MEENNKSPTTKFVVIGIVVLAALAGLYFITGGMGGDRMVDTDEEVTIEEPAEEIVDGEDEVTDQTIVEIAQADDNFSLLVAAVVEAELVDTLSGEGPFTVFAPTDAAFEALPEETLTEVMNNKELLTEILTYHVVPGKVMSDEVVDLTSATTVQGSDLTIEVMDGEVMVNDATVISTDIEASNGVIHVIDTVLMPESE